MCGHGTIGLRRHARPPRAASGPGAHRIETPVGVVDATLDDANTVTVENVPSYRHAAKASRVAGRGARRGHRRRRLGRQLVLPRRAITARSSALANVGTAHRLHLARPAGARAGRRHRARRRRDRSRRAVRPAASRPGADSRNFVLCPGGAYDRSPCGTGTSAKLACLLADGKLRPGEVWRQESIIGSVFEAWYTPHGSQVLPVIRGQAWVTAESILLMDPHDPQCWGLTGQ